ncbi:sugar ABC transporter ATP-binding protein [Cognatishimia sp. F0-27]|uniref:sugar ABC transporter ATP-binding protein n=1 Tax=Cognatishimia sp. F0-27 TaxID=2816855 RepID=UPI001D0C9162|nr:sugar ABC transporter ATP-binding protein [Cognatishimia sp. F0-27]MCC1495028.1 sugar ABC transporter ATP-binding protein [Cognatishimia sp. F0-27]
MTAALDISNLSKRFGGAVALDDVSLHVARGEVHGLLGSNGSGKSTLIKVLAGFHEPEPGAEIRLYGSRLSLPVRGPEARARGLAFVHQNLGLIPSLSVVENLYLGEFATQPDWTLNWRRLHARAEHTFARFGLNLDPRAEVGRLSAVEQALLAIVRAYDDLSQATKDHADRPGVLVLDEPTPFLPRAGVEQLFDLVRRCTATGASVIFVSHDVDEVREITDRATILRDGHLIDTVQTASTSHEGFVERIIGRNLDAYGGHAKALQHDEPLAEVTGLAAPGIGPVDLSLRAGEILGVTGLIGSGFDQVPAALFGARSGVAGRLRLKQRGLRLSDVTPAEALRRGIVYLPADRLGQAGVGSLSVGDNVAMPIYERLKTAFGLTTRRINAHASQLGAIAGVKPNNPSLPLEALSGGNAQKAVLAKWLQTDPDLLLLDEPTQGVDVGARQAIWDALDRAAADGAGVIVASTDYDQLAAICHRVLIFARGQVVSELQGADLTKETIAEQCYRSMSRIA